eukprot:snap_masked-scaffold_27-processed-gene-2.14-mRNA-1 protein AED:1.00 eAED:1.00 QI:0/0/0/0/1/1/2/0/336
MGITIRTHLLFMSFFSPRNSLIICKKKLPALNILLETTSEAVNPLNVYQKIIKLNKNEQYLQTFQTAFSTIVKALCGPIITILNQAEEKEYLQVSKQILNVCLTSHYSRQEKVNVNSLYYVGAPWNQWYPTWHSILQISNRTRQRVLFETLLPEIDPNVRKYGYTNGMIEVSETALHAALMWVDEVQSEYFISRLIEKGANADALAVDCDFYTDEEGCEVRFKILEPSLHIALKQGNENIISLLIQKGANVELPSVKCNFEKKLKLRREFMQPEEAAGFEPAFLKNYSEGYSVKQAHQMLIDSKEADVKIVSTRMVINRLQVTEEKRERLMTICDL